MSSSSVSAISGAHYRSLIQNVDMPVIGQESDDHVVNIKDRALAGLLGYTLSETSALGPRELRAPEAP